MILLVLTIPVYFLFLRVIYLRLIAGFQPGKRAVRLLKIAGLSLTCGALLLLHLYRDTTDIFPPASVAGIWLRVVIFGFIFFVLETGISKMFPQFRRRIVLGAVGSTILYVALDLVRRGPSPPFSGIIWFSVVFLVIYLLLLFIFIRVSRGLYLNQFRQGVLICCLWLITSLVIVIMYLKNPLLFLITEIWLGIIALACSVFVVETVVSLVAGKFRRRIIGISLLIIVVLTAVALYNGLRVPVIREVNITMAKLPPELAGFTIVQLSDLHLENFNWQKRWFSNVVNICNGLDPDLIVITGDIFDRSFSDGKEYPSLLAKLTAKYGVFAVIGNHEYYSGLKRSLEILKKAGIEVLRNRSVRISDGIDLAGVDDPQGRAFGNRGPDLKTALANISRDNTVILLNHRPTGFSEARKMGVDLQLSGHTHFGQIPPMNLIVYFYYKYPYGLYREGNDYIFTSSGTRLWGMPMRLFSVNEIVKITLNGKGVAGQGKKGACCEFGCQSNQRR